MIKKQMALIIIFMVFMLANSAAASSPASYDQAMGRMNTFMQAAAAATNNILNDNELNNFVNALWNAFAIILLVSALAKWNFGGIELYEIVHLLLLILITRIMLNHYNMLTTLMWDWSDGIAGSVQKAVIGNSDPLFLSCFINDVVAGIKASDVSILDSVRLFINGLIMSGIVMILSVLSFFASTWALYGYALAKILGWFFIPCLMIKRLSFLFDGWVRLFTGFIIYGIVARANLMLAVLAMKSYLGIPGYAVNTNTTYSFSLAGMADIAGMVGFMIIAILALISTSRFASTIASGAGGFGQSISSAAYSLSRMVKGF